MFLDILFYLIVISLTAVVVMFSVMFCIFMWKAGRELIANVVQSIKNDRED